MSVQTIELDCAPGGIRPGDLLPGVLKDTGIPVRKPKQMFFGEWVWDYNDIPADVWKAHNATIRERIEQLYYDGLIRFGSW